MERAIALFPVMLDMEYRLRLDNPALHPLSLRIHVPVTEYAIMLKIEEKGSFLTSIRDLTSHDRSRRQCDTAGEERKEREKSSETVANRSKQPEHDAADLIALDEEISLEDSFGRINLAEGRTLAVATGGGCGERPDGAVTDKKKPSAMSVFFNGAQDRSKEPYLF
ncbi:unnamed protein product [Gongylonema pulchrum]|uniref:Uncharacterized protein n=1 Tax=Gongylonema pulchrum TaxID=637853 RepID=A0A183D977_9BILA|nr:unnamed protein product [Gongylonema pulchrum]